MSTRLRIPMAEPTLEFVDTTPGSLRIAIADAIETWKGMATVSRFAPYCDIQVGRLHQLATDGRMRDVHGLLISVFKDDAQWRRFAVAACRASFDFALERESLQVQRRLKDRMKATLGQLVSQIDELRELAGVEDDGNNPVYSAHPEMAWPNEIFALPAQADFFVRDNPSASLKAGIAHLEAELNAEEQSGAEVAPPVVSPTVVVRGFALDPREIAAALNRSVRDWRPGFHSGPSAVVLTSQKNSAKTQYVRSFWYELTTGGPCGVRWEKEPSLLKAIAQVATIMLARPEDEVSYALVKEALKDFPR